MDEIRRFEMPVEDIFTITGRGTVFVGKIHFGTVSIGDNVILKTQSKEIRLRVTDIQEPGVNRSIGSAGTGQTVGIATKKVDLSHIPNPRSASVLLVSDNSISGQGEPFFSARTVGLLLMIAAAAAALAYYFLRGK